MIKLLPKVIVLRPLLFVIYLMPIFVLRCALPANHYIYTDDMILFLNMNKMNVNAADDSFLSVVWVS